MIRIKLVPAKRKIAMNQFDPLRRYVRELEQKGYCFVENNPDLIFIQKFNSVPPLLKSLTKIAPVVIFGDEASTGTSAFHFMKIPAVIGYVKKQLLRDMDLYKYKYPRNRYHYYMIGQLNDTMPGHRRPDRRIKDDILNRIHLGWSLGLADRHGINVTRFPDLRKNRSIHVHMSMKTKTKFKYEPIIAGKFDNHYAFHRSSCEYYVDKIAKKYGLVLSGKCKKQVYLDKMEDSKVCICAHGLGEVTWREFEAISHGSIIIKPSMDHMRAWPDIYQPWKTYVPVKLDWSDLEETLIEVLTNYDKYKKVAVNAFNVLKEPWDGQVFANFFDQLMQDVINKGGDYVEHLRK